MSLNRIILKNFFRNIRNYGLYIFALIFSVSLYFSFVLMSKDESAAEELSSSTLMSTGFLVGSVLLVIIIVTFVMFANSIFLKRRNTELALFQLIGLNRNKVFRILLQENAIIYFGSLVIGILLGFLLSRILLMVLLRVMQVELSVGLTFSMEAVLQTAVLFVVIFVLLLVQNFIFLKRTKLIDMITLNRTNESDSRRLGVGTILMGILGISMIAVGYYLSTALVDYIEWAIPLMFIVLGLVIIGTYITFKFSIAFILNMIRKSKKGHVNVTDVLSLTSIMFKMKSNAFLLTMISIVSALSVGLMSLSYITYYSTGSMVENSTPHDYIFEDAEGLSFYDDLLAREGIEHETFELPAMEYNVETKGAISADLELMDMDDSILMMMVVSDAHFESMDLGPNETVITGTSGVMQTFIDYSVNEPLTFTSGDYKHSLELADVQGQSILPSMVTFGFPTAIVDDSVYQEFSSNQSPEVEGEGVRTMYALDITGEDSMEIFNMMDQEENPYFDSQIENYTTQMQMFGMTMFVIAFVGFSFLLTSGCILYFKQVGESEDERGSYNVLRKLGFSQREITRGLSIKMIITFGIPLLIGLLHAYFAVNAGWFMFGTEMWTPMLIVMAVYTAFYSLFAILSLVYYKRVVRESLA
ncbi:FtsX-like permease family protein [Salinicoccus sp. ID82-1]|uniref:FtsX-like permease family protein n=1 Tax=Salinicoccus sp. ID82-1 TaxID=2820269 RepID=UPI001F02148D|nr:FtsX-like permease family protein [Salinicoccus sp. ID82-1]MCG1009786.1 FtsX-like permease family protein [Salinicoccus sp. ID82-1]